jgi:hypothetical protein
MMQTVHDWNHVYYYWVDKDPRLGVEAYQPFLFVFISLMHGTVKPDIPSLGQDRTL